MDLVAGVCTMSIIGRLLFISSLIISIDGVQALYRIQIMYPGLGTKCVGVTSPCKPRERGEMQVHPGD
jgi:hypothetical protein